MIDNPLNKAINYLPSSVVTTAAQSLKTGEKIIKRIITKATKWRKDHTLDFSLVKTWLSLEKIYENTPTLKTFMEQIQKLAPISKRFLENLKAEEYKKQLEAYIAGFYSIAVENWNNLKNCKTQMERFELMLKIIGETVSQNTGLKNFDEMSKVMKEVSKKYIENLDILISKPEFLK